MTRHKPCNSVKLLERSNLSLSSIGRTFPSQGRKTGSTPVRLVFQKLTGGKMSKKEKLENFKEFKKDLLQMVEETRENDGYFDDDAVWILNNYFIKKEAELS